MPEIKHYDKKKHQAKKNHSNKRRPHHETEEVMTEADESTLEASDAVQGEFEGMADESQRSAHAESDAINTEAQNEGARASAEHLDTETASEDEHIKVHLNFYGSELIRQKAPKVMDIADTVADEWVHDGKFEGLPLGNPLAQMAAAKALRTAKDVEKKLEEKGVFTMAKIGVDYLKSKIEKKK